ncbi:MBL fold metallo-hydrolase [Halopseudomonas formosensis]|uniref:MBL fold metallo-hydrolase n=1 Tax=Halopseudomonas formosensis TaxID=1002526 RepID=A0ABU5BXM7_9GAMM|nr:MBL fold metallo-hydrolase [Halopseudomonas formosensis]MDX9687523.1 MBL fold metallo-hydrolase [Halopseudomonas formosensis]
MTYPKIEHHGAINGVTGSCHQLHLTPDSSVLIDCGLFQGAEVSQKGAHATDMAIEFSLTGIQALIVTHVHIDHVGRLPWLMAAGFKGPVFCTEPSAMLLPTVLEDAFLLGIRRDAQLADRFIKRVEPMLRPATYREWITVINRDDLVLRIRFQRAGHILGSAWVECDVHYPRERRRRRIIFSGDLGAPHAPILPPPDIPYSADVVILESTYGDRLHEDRRTRRQRLQRALEQALSDGGTVLIPAFSIGRTQELLYELEAIISGQEGDWLQMPVILDAPLAARFTQLYRQLKPYWDKEALRRVAAGHKPLGFEQLLTVNTHGQHLAMVNRLAQTRQPAIVITGNGMCSAGRVVNYLKAMLGDSRHNVIFTGFQAQGTPGRAIQKYGPQGGYVELEGERFDIRAGITTLGGYSAHADQAGLVKFVTGMRHWPQQVRLVHGELYAKQQLADALREKARRYGRNLEVLIP